MGPSARSEHHLNLGYLPQLGSGQPKSGSSTTATSPTEAASNSGNPLNSAFASMQALNASGAAPTRGSAGSPSHEYGGSRLYSKRAREIQAQEGLAPQVWGPPTSGNSTPLRETIPESPTGDSFPDFNQGSSSDALGPPSTGRSTRTRAGTLPSRFSPALPSGGVGTQSSLLPKTSRPTPSTSPFKPGTHTPTDATGFQLGASGSAAAQKSALLSRLRAGSLPQRTNPLPSVNSPFGSALFPPHWSSSRDRSSTLASIRSSDAPSSPAQSHFSRDSLAEGDVKTLDYLGLADTPQQHRSQLGPSDIEMLLEQQRFPNMAGLASFTSSANRFRSYSVNAKEKYADEDEEMYGSYSGQMTPSTEGYAAIAEAVRQHNLEVQAFASLASVSRPRARTAGVLDTPATRARGAFVPAASQLNSAHNAADFAEDSEYNGLTEAIKGMQLGGASGDDHGADAPTRALWLGNIPTSTTVSSLQMIFSAYGPIESARVLTHKNCGFINFEKRESAIAARSQLNGKEIFPGAGPVRIGYAKVPSASGTPGHNGIFPSPSPDPLSKVKHGGPEGQSSSGTLQKKLSGLAKDTPVLSQTPSLKELKTDIIDIVRNLGATDEDQMRIAHNVDVALLNNDYHAEIDPIPEPSHGRVHDAPRLREIRKRIDNGSYASTELESVAMDMLPEIAELSSDYLGNTVVQKLFEYCDEPVKEAMLHEIAPHLAEIGVHKNGTWAAQKIIDVARSHRLQSQVVEALRPYSMALFLDQFGNYVIQGCLRYGAPMNSFIFDTMLNRLWELAQGRFGARAMRACLESHHATKDQQRMIAATIALHSVQLATNANGALLLTWFLDTCTFPRRRSVLAPRLVPHLVQLCTHKVAYLTVLKIINQRNEPEARDAVLNALFFSEGDSVLTEILSDQACGATLIFKVLTTPFFDDSIRNDVIANVRNVLLKIKAQPQQGYKRLMDEVGLSVRGGGGTGPRESSRDPSEHRPMSKHSNVNNHLPQNHLNNNMNASIYNPMAAPVSGYDPNIGLQRTNSMDSTSTFDNYSMGMNINGVSPMGYSPSQAGNVGLPMQYPGMNAQQMQYQQAILAAQSQQPGRPNFYPAGMNNNFQPQNSQIEAYRPMGVGSPIHASGNSMMPSQNGYNPMMASGPGQMPIGGGQMWPQQVYGYMGGNVQPQMQPQQTGSTRRGRQR